MSQYFCIIPVFISVPVQKLVSNNLNVLPVVMIKALDS